MATYSGTLKEKTVDRLQKLIRYNIDACNGFNEAADKIDHEAVATLFRRLGEERRRQAEELKQFVTVASDEKPEDSGSATAAMHRAWIDLRAALNGGDPYVILIEAERGEDAIKGEYEDVLEETAGTPVNDVLLRQYMQVKRAHDSVRELRDSFKNR